MTREEAVNTILYQKHNVKEGSQIDQARAVERGVRRTGMILTPWEGGVAD